MGKIFYFRFKPALPSASMNEVERRRFRIVLMSLFWASQLVWKFLLKINFMSLFRQLFPYIKWATFILMNDQNMLIKPI